MKSRRRLLRPFRSARAIVAHRRSAASDAVLATILAFVAGAANAGGFFALGQYTSHMTGYLSEVADSVAILNLGVVFVGGLAISAFVAGAAFSTVLISAASAGARRQQYAWPLAIQGVFLLFFAGGGLFTSEIWRLFSLACLCFIMGMQNATITRLSGARIRTTHATGMITDIGIELGRAVFSRLRPSAGLIVDPVKLRILLQLVLAFLVGGIVGAVGYGLLGFFFSLPLGIIMLTISVPSLLHPRM
jgi:uncharacterized membrane protein YoaK (UPF0700 family)